MKKLLILIIAIACTLSFSACGAVATTSYTSPWGEGNVYEKTSYAVTRELNANGSKTDPVYTTVANGTQTVTVQKTTQAEYADCLELVINRTLTYTVADKISDSLTVPVGAVESYYSRVIFSISTTDLMKVKFSEKKVVSPLNTQSNPVNLDYTAVYDGNLKITDNLDNRNVTTYSSKAIGNGYDNEMWILLVRYASGFNRGWASTLNLISIADTLYTDKLAKFSLNAKAADAGMPNFKLPSLTSNITLRESETVFAETDGVFSTKTSEPALNVVLSQSGTLGANKGPSIKTTFLTGRSVKNKVPLANMLLYYEEGQFTTNGTPIYRNAMFLSGATITEPSL